MIHSFETVTRNNGNINVMFREGNKLRKIIFIHGTEPYSEFFDLVVNTEISTKARINRMRKKYKFMVNPKNRSIFYPLLKEQQEVA